MKIRSAEGDALRLAAADLSARFASLDVAIRSRLHVLARSYDEQAAIRAQREREEAAAEARRRARAEFDSRGRWVRRQCSNAGPGVPGRAHIATDARRTPANDTVARCGKTLRGPLEWAELAAEAPLPDGWQPCRECRVGVPSVPVKARRAGAA